MSSLPLFTPEASWQAPKEPPRLDGVKILAVDTETVDPYLKDLGPGFIRKQAYFAGVSLATKDQSWYFPWKHPEGNCEWDVQAWIQEELYVDRKYVFCNCHYDIEALWSIDAHVQGHWTDIQILQALIDEEFAPGYNLEGISRYWVGAGKSTALLDESLNAYGLQRAEIGRLPARYVGEYAETDAQRTLQSYLKQLPQIEREDLSTVLELEENLLPLSWQMRLRGIRFDRNKAELLLERWRGESKRIQNLLAVQHGLVINPRSSKALERYCIQHGVKYNKTLKGNASFTAEALEQAKDPVLQSVARMRKLDKMCGDFLETWLEHSCRDGRVHTRWLQTASEEGGTRGGRFASRDPNLQQVPVRDPYFGPEMRSLFLPEEGEKFVKFDVMSQEIRTALHYAIERGCRGAEAIQRAYIENPRLDFHQMVADIAGVPRTPAKTISLGILYGMGKDKLAYQLGFGREAAEMIFFKYREAAPYFGELAEMMTNEAESKGYVCTYLGRRRRFEGHGYTHKALNAVSQGSGADMIKIAMLNIFREMGKVPLITLHDELDFSVCNTLHGELTHDIMTHEVTQISRMIESAITFNVPMVADPIIAENWNVGK